MAGNGEEADAGGGEFRLFAVIGWNGLQMPLLKVRRIQELDEANPCRMRPEPYSIPPSHMIHLRIVTSNVVIKTAWRYLKG